MQIKKAEWLKIDAFELWCWGRFLSVPWTARRSNQSILKNQPWIFTARTDAEAETPIVWLLDAKSQFIGKNPDAGKDWKKEETGTTEDKITVWQLNGHEFEQAPGDSEGYLGSLACCSPWGHKDSETTEGLNNNNPSLHINMPLFLRVGLPGWP